MHQVRQIASRRARNPVCNRICMRNGLVIVSLFTLGLLEAAPPSIQQKLLGSDRPLSVNVERVNVLFTVASNGGKLITTLARDDFKVFEDDHPQSITNFTTETNVP